MDEGRILVVEDEPVVRRTIEMRLRAQGYVVESVDSAETALERLRQQHYALLLTDLRLDAMDGATLIVAARQIDPEIELIVLTAAATLACAITAINSQVRAFLLKPAPAGELEQRVADALARRRERHLHATILRQFGAQLLGLAEPHMPQYRVAPTGDAPMPLRLGVLEIEPQSRRVSVGGRPVSLSQGGFELLLYLARLPEQVIAPVQIANDVLGYSCSPPEARELVKARIYCLRQKIEPNPRTPRLLVSVRGVGYMLTAGNRNGRAEPPASADSYR